MISAFLEGGKWMVVKNLHLLDMNGNSGSLSPSSNRVRMVYDACWSGERWAFQRHFGMDFGSEEKANEFIQANYDRFLESF